RCYNPCVIVLTIGEAATRGRRDDGVSHGCDRGCNRTGDVLGQDVFRYRSRGRSRNVVVPSEVRRYRTISGFDVHEVAVFEYDGTAIAAITQGAGRRHQAV